MSIVQKMLELEQLLKDLRLQDEIEADPRGGEVIALLQSILAEAVRLENISPDDLTGFIGPIQSRDSWPRLWN